MDQRPFHLRRFSLYHHQSTMKVGTDSILLGAWVNAENCRKVLDVGTGCGILALMMAQRTTAEIHAVELDGPSASEAVLNFSASQWNDRFRVFNMDFVQYANETSECYELIVSNPPFFNSIFKTKDSRRKLARHTDTLSFEDLIRSTMKLLHSDGLFAVVLPVTESNIFLEIAKDYNLFPVRRLDIIPIEGRLANRYNFEFRFGNQGLPLIENFCIRNSNGSFTSQYHSFLKDYYLGL